MVLQNVAFFCSIIFNRGRIAFILAKCNTNCKIFFQFCSVKIYYNMKKPLRKVAHFFMVLCGLFSLEFLGDILVKCLFFIPPLLFELMCKCISSVCKVLLKRGEAYLAYLYNITFLIQNKKIFHNFTRVSYVTDISSPRAVNISSCSTPTSYLASSVALFSIKWGSLQYAKFAK